MNNTANRNAYLESVGLISRIASATVKNIVHTKPNQINVSCKNVCVFSQLTPHSASQSSLSYHSTQQTASESDEQDVEQVNDDQATDKG